MPWSNKIRCCHAPSGMQKQTHEDSKCTTPTSLSVPFVFAVSLYLRVVNEVPCGTFNMDTPTDCAVFRRLYEACRFRVETQR